MWFAGFLDADGCFSIILGQQRTKNPYLAIRTQVRIGQGHTPEAERTLRYIHENIKVGNIYFSNKRKSNATIYWQTTRHDDALIVTKSVYPYLILKKTRARLFIQALEAWNKGQKVSKGRFQGQKERKVKDVLKIVKIATSINKGRQTRRYRNYKGYNYWEPLIKKWYK